MGSPRTLTAVPNRNLVVVPTFNEKPNLEVLVQGIREQGCEVLVVDDNSPDGTGELADRLAAADPGVTVLHRPGKLGLGTAHTAGLNRGVERGFDLVLTMDADGSHRPDHLPALLDTSGGRRCVTIGSRYIPGGSIVGWTGRRKLLSHFANLYCRGLLGVEVHDCTSGYRCYPREVLERIDLATVTSDGYAFLIEVLHRCVRAGIAVAEVPIRFEDRVAGTSKVSAAEIGKALALVPRLRWAQPRGLRTAEEVELSGAPVRHAAPGSSAEPMLSGDARRR